MSASLTSEESSIVDILERNSITRTMATIAVAMVTREHARPEDELIDILRQYQGLEDREQIVAAIATLKEWNWLEKYETYGLTLLRQSSDLRDKIEKCTKTKNIKRRLSSLRATNDPVVRLIGSMTDDEAYSSYLARLHHAKDEICLPMLATTPKLRAADILKKRAVAGVKVKILLADPKVTSQLRGNTMRKTSEESIEGWKQHADSSPNIQLRISSRVEDMWLASCALIDDTVLRIDIYDPKRQRSLQGTLIEVSAGNDLRPNIVSVFRAAFDDAWKQAQPRGTLSRVWYAFTKHWHWFAFVTMFFLAFAFRSVPTLSAVCASAAATFFVTSVIASWSSLSKYVRTRCFHD